MVKSERLASLFGFELICSAIRQKPPSTLTFVCTRWRVRRKTGSDENYVAQKRLGHDIYTYNRNWSQISGALVFQQWKVSFLLGYCYIEFIVGDFFLLGSLQRFRDILRELLILVQRVYL